MYLQALGTRTKDGEKAVSELGNNSHIRNSDFPFVVVVVSDVMSELPMGLPFVFWAIRLDDTI